MNHTKKDDIAEARFQLYLALEGVRQSNDPDSIPGEEYAQSLLESADAYALAVLDAAEKLPSHGEHSMQGNCPGCAAAAELRARIPGQGALP